MRKLREKDNLKLKLSNQIKKALDNYLQIEGGEITKIEGIRVENNKWIFVNDDPKIIISFHNPTSFIRISYDIKECDFGQGVSTIYYKGKSEAFSEKRTIKLNFMPNKRLVREISFENPVWELRFDPVDFTGMCDVKSISICLTEGNGILDELLENNTSDDSIGKCVLITHDLSLSGAPLLASHIADGLKSAGVEVVVLAAHFGGGCLAERYAETKIPLIYLDGLENNEFGFINVSEEAGALPADRELFSQKVISILRGKNYNTVITNSIVSGEFAGLLKDKGFKIISLIHEMKTTITHYNFGEFGKAIACNSDYIIFPSKIVENDFKQLYPQIGGKCLVRSQGVYLERNSGYGDSISLSEYGLSKEDYIVMSSGMCELRKGIDFFVNAALMLCQKHPCIHYVWAGNFYDEELECWIMSQIERSKFKDRFHFIPFIKDHGKYKELLKNADVFWALSREDPFPSTVLEAMDNRVAVIGFKGTGGIEEMLSEGRGVLVDGFNLYEIAKATEALLANSGSYESMREKAKDYVGQLDFESYVEFLMEYLGKDTVIQSYSDFGEGGGHFYHRQLREKSFEEKKKALRQAKRNSLLSGKRSDSKIVLLDTAEGSDNLGDKIIMDYCGGICQDIFQGKEFLNIPTHIYDKKAEHIKPYFKILCGTNLIYTRMEDSRQWALPERIDNYRNICLLGVGMQQIGLEYPMSDYSKEFLRFVLDSRCLHSVRDEQTKNRLGEIGIKNVLNTSCPTMWELTKEHCLGIPVRKADTVLTTVTDYMQDAEMDRYMLETLRRNYRKVYLWIQGQVDYQYLKQIVNVNDYAIVPPSLESFDMILKSEEIDYIGTRLHAGIRCLNYCHRSLIIGIDNRAEAIANDTNLPVLKRTDLKEVLEEYIYQERETDIQLPEDNIRRWKEQFLVR